MDFKGSAFNGVEGQSSSPSFRSPGLDLFRAVAILLVLACHVHLMWSLWTGRPLNIWIAVAGLVGVQLFFVLSGFLIGRILIRQIGGGARVWLVFMARRWMRTLPLYWLVLVILIVVWPPLFGTAHPGARLPHLLTYGLLAQNLVRPISDGWFSVSWSLAVEEWFYLAFSALLLGLGRWLRPGLALGLALLVFLLSSPLLRVLLLGSFRAGGDDHIVLLWLDGLAIGVLSAVVLGRVRPGRLASVVWLAVGLGLVVFDWSGGLGHVAALAGWPRRLLDNDILSLGAALCLPAALGVTRLPAPLGWISVRLSAWSYSIYLTHLAVLEIGGFYGRRAGLAPTPLAAGCVVVTLVMAWASWRFFEAPILARRPGTLPLALAP